MNELVSEFIKDLVTGQHSADISFLEVANQYKNTNLESFPIPRYVIPNAEADLKIAVSR